MNLTGSKKTLALAGVICGLVAACLAYFGNPANMAFCIACFIRDTAGAMGMHQAEAVMYARPEIIGLVLGAFIISIATKEFRSTGGSSPMIRFVLGVIIMIGALVFLGCPLRMVLRMSAGDLNAWVIWVIIFCYAVFFVFMKWTTLGRRIYAVGSNPSAAEVSGINVKNIKLLVYTIMGLLAGLGGALQVSIYASAMPDMQQGGEMDVIAACVIGGVSMSGGRGTVLGALLGSLILATIAKALPLIPFFDQLWLNTIKGVIILVVVVVNIVLQRTADKNALKGREM